MSCLHFVNLMALAAGGDLEGAELRLLEDHLVGCEACRAFMEELDQSQRALLNLSQVEVSEGMEAGPHRSRHAGRGPGTPDG